MKLARTNQSDSASLAVFEARRASHDPIIADGGDLPTQAVTRIEGANACLEAMRRARQIVSKGEQYHLEQGAAKAAVLGAAGPVPHRAAGVLALLTDLIVAEMQDGYSIEELLDQIADSSWQPEATMTEAVEGDLLPRSHDDGRVAEEGIMLSLWMMGPDEKFELLKAATKILNAKTKRMNKALRVARARAPKVRINPPRIRTR